MIDNCCLCQWYRALVRNWDQDLDHICCAVYSSDLLIARVRAAEQELVAVPEWCPLQRKGGVQP